MKNRTRFVVEIAGSILVTAALKVWSLIRKTGKGEG